MSRAPYQPTPKDRAMVETMAAAGIQQDEICACLGITGKTLRRHFRAELDTAHARANASVAQRLYKAAMAGNTAAMIFWLKCRARWKPASVHEIVGQDGGPIRTKSELDPSRLEPEDAQKLLDLIEKASS